jgi:ABC-2 type transport system ATP-binding protein
VPRAIGLGVPPVLEVCGLSKSYSGLPAVSDISFTLSPYEVLGYLGPNGSGKSTTVNMLTGLLEPARGSILFCGRDTREDLAGYKKRLGYVPEEPHIYPYLSGREYLQLIGRLRQIPAKALEEKIDALLYLFALYPHRYSLISSYSKGMRQKVLISAALLHDPDLVIFDEPLSGLDVTTAMVFKNLVLALAAGGKMILYSSHVLDVVEKVCSKVIVLHRGRMVAYDSVEHLRTLMQMPSLEDIFAQLVFQDDTEKIAREIVCAIRS